ncbi:MAG: DoxX family protein [Bacteroidota bacterium]|nr:DoxX family protein [Bacteroidota bacterium]
MTQEVKQKKGLNITLWVLQVLLAAMYLMAGYQKTFGDLDVIVKTIFWVGYTPALLVRFIGTSELLAAIGLILPAALKIRPQLTTLAAAGISTIMLLANLMHAYRGEFFVLPMTLPILLLAAFVAYGRWKLAPIAQKG